MVIGKCEKFNAFPLGLNPISETTPTQTKHMTTRAKVKTPQTANEKSRNTLMIKWEVRSCEKWAKWVSWSQTWNIWQQAEVSEPDCWKNHKGCNNGTSLIRVEMDSSDIHLRIWEGSRQVITHHDQEFHTWRLQGIWSTHKFVVQH